MRLGTIFSVLALSTAIVGCGDDTNTNPDMTAPADLTPDPRAGFVAVNFSVDDSANKVFMDGDLEWKGSMKIDATTMVIMKDSNWGGPFAKLYDDGAWDKGGHEPAGATKGDNIWGVTVWVKPPATGEDKYEYGLIDAKYEKDYGNGWIWKGSNGSFTIKSDTKGSIKADGMTFAKFGTTDMKLVFDKANVDKTGTWDVSKVGVKGSGWSWATVALTDDGKGMFPFELGTQIGAGKPFSHTGLFSTGDKPEFIYVLGAGAGKEYKDAGGTGLFAGVKAYIKKAGDTQWTETPIKIATNKNPYIEIP